MVEALRAALPQPADIVETHISWVLLSGDCAYKIKKAVDFGFLDFSTLDKRRFFCREELRLNRRLSPQLYLDVVAISGSVAAPKLGSEFPPLLEYAVKMRRFPQAAQLDAMLANGALLPSHIDAIAARIAAFHRGAVVAIVAAEDCPYGTPEAVHQPVTQNFTQIRPRLSDAADLDKLRRIEDWSEGEFKRLAAVFAQRKQHGFIRECHGDLHLANLAWFEGEITPFDCIEFSANLRWIDVISEIAFLAMDLHDKKRPDMAWRLLNAYLQQSGDYAGLALLRYYLAYRALVRAKVACLRSKTAIAEGAVLEVCRDYLNLGESFTWQGRPAIIITHGLSGSGKTTVAGALAVMLGALHLRSDIERKRLYGLAATARSGSSLDGGLYTEDGHRRTYRSLAELAQTIVAAGYAVIVDAAFLKQAERSAFRQIAAERRIPFVILDFHAPAELLRRRIVERERAGKDASEATLAVLERQLAGAEPLSAAENAWSMRIDTCRELAPAALFLALQSLLENAA